jgi:hypothetical protein
MKKMILIKFICAVFWKIGQVLLDAVDCLLSPFATIVDDIIEACKDLLDEYQNRKNSIVASPSTQKQLQEGFE